MTYCSGNTPERGTREQHSPSYQEHQALANMEQILKAEFLEKPTTLYKSPV